MKGRWLKRAPGPDLLVRHTSPARQESWTGRGETSDLEGETRWLEPESESLGCYIQGAASRYPSMNDRRRQAVDARKPNGRSAEACLPETFSEAGDA